MNHLLADDSHVISSLIIYENEEDIMKKISQNLSSGAVMIGILRANKLQGQNSRQVLQRYAILLITMGQMFDKTSHKFIYWNCLGEEISYITYNIQKWRKMNKILPNNPSYHVLCWQKRGFILSFISVQVMTMMMS